MCMYKPYHSLKNKIEQYWGKLKITVFTCMLFCIKVGSYLFLITAINFL